MTELLRVLIADDERPARAKLRRYLAEDATIEVVGEATCGREAVELIRGTEPDLVFLDVQMPDLDGFAVLDELDADERPNVVFVTAHDEFALRAFEVHALDYVLKPTSRDRFAKVVEHARRRIADVESGKLAERLESLLADARAHRRYADRLLVPSGERSIVVPVARIDAVKADRNYVILRVGGAEHRMRGTLDSLTQRLDPERFVRVNRSEVVNVDRIREVQAWFHGDSLVVLQDGSTVVWTRRYFDQAPEWLRPS